MELFEGRRISDDGGAVGSVGGDVVVRWCNSKIRHQPNPDKGNIRETFLLNQLENTGAEVFAHYSSCIKSKGMEV
jgi:hypothetical protein